MLEIDSLDFAYAEGVPALAGLTLSLGQGRVACLLGPSGSGKTTLLRCIAGFELPTRGMITVAGRRLNAPDTFVPPERRGVGLVFQDYALLPHLTVVERRKRTTEVLELVGLGELARRYPHELSGGQQQRVALARSLAPDPDLLLLDEPFAHLDPVLRRNLPAELRRILAAAGTTALAVSHDPEEAFGLADVIGVMREGVLEQWDDAYDVYHAPATPFVAEFVGPGVWLEGTTRADGGVDTLLGVADGGDPVRSLGAGRAVRVFLRPDDVTLVDVAGTPARIESRSFRGAYCEYALVLDSGARVLAAASGHDVRPPGEQVALALATPRLVCFARAS